MSTWQQLDTAGWPCWELDLPEGFAVLIYRPEREPQQYLIIREARSACSARIQMGRATSAAEDGLAGAQRVAGELVQQLCTETIAAMGEAG